MFSDMMQEMFVSYVYNGLPILLMAFLTFCFWWLLGVILCKSLNALIHKGHSEVLIIFLSSLVKKACLALGILFAVSYLGIDVTGILAGLGLTGFALGFALKDMFSNFIGGVSILLYRPFKLDDVIRIETSKVVYKGSVKAIDLRYTTLESEGEKTLVPNAMLFTEPITISKK